MTLIPIVDWDLSDGFAGIAREFPSESTGVVNTVTKNLADGEEREEQQEPDSSPRHVETDWTDRQESSKDYIEPLVLHVSCQIYIKIVIFKTTSIEKILIRKNILKNCKSFRIKGF